MQEIEITVLAETVKTARIIIDSDLCKGSDCHLCISLCSRKVLGQGCIYSKFGGMIPEIVNSFGCTFCRQCELHCPELCISIEEGE
ncbi:MAG: hypothetical protein ACFFD4_16995 [Candidatus Odinarchaeota archaeon]